MSAVLQRTVGAAGRAASEVMAMERGGGEEGASGKADGRFLGSKQTISALNVGVFYSWKGRSNKDSSGRCSRKTRGRARSVATGVTIGAKRKQTKHHSMGNSFQLSRA